ncbi:putative Protein kinase [Taphrina deformans PYCC 5710]|uniref:non-specific serine/threonine protein kinase n=1 Tax=Taphrina deformans (strain PYCC 5710 / ATCC 11124 / CBS 356.35 / IMI 108563 / JCM 9778 / NBRC 8474) TaxID=1097556 RepID=R4X8H2_TAPDE|nr:putative Protein kinase [Taphrina deformans PYCC 5710]|eukprot:CCG81606.1 putative Protein kinase [Taphrina deformans PYCC 5710]
MGNNNSTISNAATLDSYIGELHDLSFVKSLSSSRFLKCVLGKHIDGQVVVKLFVKSNIVNLQEYIRQSEVENDQLLDIPNALSYQRLQETDRAVYLVRQYIASNLYDRVSTRPFLEAVEKRWIVFQLLTGLQDCHARGIRHGDIKTENVLVTSWNWVYLTDFAFFKPTYLPENNPADFSYFFDTSFRRTCYIAPERFHTASEPKKGPVTDAMDIFSLGCVIAELFLEGISLFDLSQMLRYKAGEYDPKFLLDKINDLEIRSLIGHMINIDPDQRYSAEKYLQKWQRRAFPHYFTTFMHEYLSLVTEPQRHHVQVPSRDIDDSLDRIFFEFDKVSFFLKFDDTDDKQHASLDGRQERANLLSIPNYRRIHNNKIDRAESDNGALVFLSILLTGLRNTTRTASRIRACETIVALSDKISDEAKLDRVVPFFVDLLTDDAPEVRSNALWSLAEVLSRVTILTPVNAFIFSDYILPKITNAVFASSSLVRVKYAQCITTIIRSAERFYDMAHALCHEGFLTFSSPKSDVEVDEKHQYNYHLRSGKADQTKLLENHLVRLLTDPSTAVKRALLPHIVDLTTFFGPHRGIDLLLGHLISYLNDRDWLLRIAFFDHVVPLGQYLGQRAVETYIVPVMIQALVDSEDFIVEKVLNSLASLCSAGLIGHPSSTSVCALIVRFLIHPNLWIREAATNYVAIICKSLTPADLYSIVYPLVKPFLRMEVMFLTPVAILQSLKRPLSQQALDIATKWAMETPKDKASYWTTNSLQRDFSGDTTSIAPYQNLPILSENSSRRSLSSPVKIKPARPAERTMGLRTQEDEYSMSRLRDTGLKPEDDWKLTALREYIYRRSKQKKEQELLQQEQYKVQETPRPITIFFDDLVQEIVIPEYQRSKHNAAHDVHTALRDASYNLESNRARRSASRTMSNIKSVTSTAPVVANKLRPPNNILNSATSTIAAPITQTGAAELNLHKVITNESASGSKASSINGESKALSLRASSAVNLPGMSTKAQAEVSTTNTVVLGQVDHQCLDLPETGTTRKTSRRSEAPTASHSYNGFDESVINMLEKTYVNSLSNTVEVIENGAKLTPARARVAPEGSWKDEVVLVAHVQEHIAAINCVRVAPDHTFFVTCSDDGTIKLWESGKLERNVTNRARHTYRGLAGSKVKCVTFLENSYCIAAASDQGIIHVIECKQAQTHGSEAKGMKFLKSYDLPPQENVLEMIHVMQDQVSTLLVTTTKSRILAIDLQKMCLSYALQNPVHHGTISSLCTNDRKTWLLLGTSRGILDLWDLRFRLKVKSIGLPTAGKVNDLCLHPCRGGGRWVCVVTAGSTEITVWDIEKSVCREVYRPFGYPGTATLDNYKVWNVEESKPEELLAKFTHEIALESSQSRLRTSGRVLISAGNVYKSSQSSSTSQNRPDVSLICASTDRMVRRWDLYKVEQSSVISTIHRDAEQMSYQATTSGNLVINEEVASKSSSRSKSKSARLPSNSPLKQNEHLKAHMDIILDLACLQWPYKMLISVDRSGVLKVFA